MTKKKEEPHRISLDFVPSATQPMVSFINLRSALAVDGRGSISVETSTDRYVFKVNDVVGIIDTQDDYIMFHLKTPSKGEDEMMGFYKKDIRMFYVDFSHEVRYKSEGEKDSSRFSDNMVS